LRYPAKIVTFISNFACSLCIKRIQENPNGCGVHLWFVLTWNDPVRLKSINVALYPGLLIYKYQVGQKWSVPH